MTIYIILQYNFFGDDCTVHSAYTSKIKRDEVYNKLKPTVSSIFETTETTLVQEI